MFPLEASGARSGGGTSSTEATAGPRFREGPVSPVLAYASALEAST